MWPNCLVPGSVPTRRPAQDVFETRCPGGQVCDASAVRKRAGWRTRFVGLPHTPGGKPARTYLYRADRKTRVRQVLWGDWLTIDGEEAGRAGCASSGRQRGRSPKRSLIPKEAYQRRTGRWRSSSWMSGRATAAVLISPERGAGERIMVIDAG